MYSDDVGMVTGALVSVCLGVGVRGDECHSPTDKRITESWSSSLSYLKSLTQFLHFSLVMAGSLLILWRQ